MVCPFCKVEYTADQPCFCQPTLQSKPEEPRVALGVRVSSESEPIYWNTSRGNRID